MLVELLPDERARVAVPESGGAIELPLADIAERYTGHALFARPQVRFDRRADQMEGVRAAPLVLGQPGLAWPTTPKSCSPRS